MCPNKEQCGKFECKKERARKGESASERELEKERAEKVSDMRERVNRQQ